jgi:hypothetical protein
MREASLDRGIGGVERRANESDARGDIDHHRVTARAQNREGSAREENGGQKVDRDHCFDLGFRDFFQPPGPYAARIVDEHVKAAHGLQRMLQRDGAAVRRRDIGRDARDLRARTAKLAHGIRQNVRSAAADRDLRALAQEFAGHGQADTAGSAGDEDSLAFEVHRRLLRLPTDS